MDAWLIKLGKAWAAIRREGVLRGGKRTIRAFFSLFHRVGSGDILFVASGVGDSARYRCHHVAEYLRLQGFRVSVTPQDTWYLSRFSEKFSVFVFHRTSWTPAVKSLVCRLKGLGKTVIFDTDDLTFDAELFKQTAAYEAMNALERRQYRDGIGIEFLKSPAVSAVTTSTTFLAERLRVFGKPVFVVPNCLSSEDVRVAEVFSKEGMEEKGARIKNKELEVGKEHLVDVASSSKAHSAFSLVIGYFSGSTGHDRDFAMVAPVLKRLLDDFQCLRIFIGGPLSLPKTLEPYSSRIDRVPFVPRAENFRNIAKVDINIAPLEVGDPFCEAKSELKFFEAGIVEVPTVAAATRTFREVIIDGIDGFVAKDENEWRTKLERLIVDVELRKSMGARARETALRRCVTTTARDDAYCSFLRSEVDRS